MCKFGRKGLINARIKHILVSTENSITLSQMNVIQWNTLYCKQEHTHRLKLEVAYILILIITLQNTTNNLRFNIYL